MSHGNLFAREPLGYQNQIPIFSEPNEYTDNYERISSDHLASLQQDGRNPFITEDLWVEFERSTIKLIRKYSNTGDSILDVGVGLGRLLSHFPLLQRYGVDISLGYLEVARSQGIDVCYALVEDLPYQEETFDLVVCTDVLEHVLDLNRSCANMLSVLKPAGHLIVRVPYREDLSQYLAPDYPYRFVHLRAFEESSLRLLFERVFDCRVVETAVAGFQRASARFRYPPSPIKWSGVCDRFLPHVWRLHRRTHDALLRCLYYPIVINVVVAKR